MEFIVRHNAERVGPGPATARLNQAGELVAGPWLQQLAMEGKMFSAGTGLEEAAVDGETTLSDQAATFTLASASGSGKLVIPLSMTISRDTEGANNQTLNALLHMVYGRTDLNAVGTELVPINMRGDQGPSPTAKFLSTVTLDATTDQDTWVSLAMRLHIIEGWQNTETAVAGGSETEGFGQSVARPKGRSVFEFHYDFLRMHVPLILTGGSSVSFFTFADGTADGFNANVLWLELPTDKYGL